MKQPYATIPGRVLAYLQERCPCGGTVQIGVRAMAAAIGCSAGSISPAYATLEADGYIRRLPSGGSWIEVVAPDQLIDRPESDQSADRQPTRSDQSADRPRAKRIAVRSTPPPHTKADQSVDRPQRRRDVTHKEATNTPATMDRIKTACMVDHDSCKQQQQPPPLRAVSDSAAPPGFWGRTWHELVASGYTAERAESDIAALMRQRGYNRPKAIATIIEASRRDEPIYYRQENASDGPPTPRARRGAAPYRRKQQPSMDLTPDEFADEMACMERWLARNAQIAIGGAYAGG